MRVKLRDYQERGRDGLRAAYAAGRRAPLYVLPTGGGKTTVFSAIAEGASSRDTFVMILVHRKELLKQASDRLDELGVAHGLIHPAYKMTGEPVQVASVNTLIRRIDRLRGLLARSGRKRLLIIIDEAHHATAGMWLTVRNAFPDAYLLGVTATPIRLDGKGLGVEAGGVFDFMIEGPTVSELIAAGYLCKPTVYTPPSELDLSGVHRSGGDFRRSELEAATDRPAITGDAVAHYRRLCSGAPAIVFTTSVRHGEHVAEDFRRAGYQALMIDGNTDDKVRAQAVRDLGRGSLNLLVSCDLISEGFDCPNVVAAILLRATQSTGLYLQQVGRALRPAPGKERAIILDHVGNSGRMRNGVWVPNHGLPDDDREWSLDGRKKGQRKQRDEDEINVAVRQCPQCYTAHAPLPKCPACGHVYQFAAEMPNVADGELEEVTDEQREQAQRERRKEVAQARTAQQIHEVARARGYKPGWARFRINYLRERGLLLPDESAA